MLYSGPFSSYATRIIYLETGNVLSEEEVLFQLYLRLEILNVRLWEADENLMKIKLNKNFWKPNPQKFLILKTDCPFYADCGSTRVENNTIIKYQKF